MDVTAFSQRDQRWADVRLGEGRLTIGRVGCLLCAAASMLATWGWPTNPLRLNAFLRQHEGYVDGNLFVFGAMDGNWCKVREVIRCEKTAAPVERLNQALADGAGVLACVDAQPGGKLQRHWVWLVEPGVIIDPWQLPGNERQGLKQYLAAGWTPERGIFAAAIYERLAGRRTVAWLGPIEDYQETICYRRD
jgi:hypothetical protein